MKGLEIGMKLLIDTNIILDIIFNRKGCEDSMSLFRKAERDGTNTYITASMVTDLFYIIHKETHDTEMTYRILENIFKLTSIMAVTEQDIVDAFGEKWRDFEDCVQFTVAKNNKIDCIITGNAKDYTNSSIPVMSPIEYLQT
jgi:predicted nucleic acid-binding protein